MRGANEDRCVEAKEAFGTTHPVRGPEEGCLGAGEGAEGRDQQREAGAEEAHLTSVWDMLKRYAEAFYQVGSMIATIQSLIDEKLHDQIKRISASDGRARDEAFGFAASTMVKVLAERVEQLGLTYSLKSVGRLERMLRREENERPTAQEISDALAEIDRWIRDELEERVLYYVAPGKATHYEDFRHGWEEALAVFPIAADVEEAEKCFALERWTGCVFHLMRVVEIGVQGLAVKLKITVAATEPWGTIVRHIQNAVKSMPHATAAEKEDQARLGGIADALFQVNLAWRIPAMHPRTPGDKYTEDEAEDCLGRVKALMRHLAGFI